MVTANARGKQTQFSAPVCPNCGSLHKYSRLVQTTRTHWERQFICAECDYEFRLTEEHRAPVEPAGGADLRAAGFIRKYGGVRVSQDAQGRDICGRCGQPLSQHVFGPAARQGVCVLRGAR